MGACAVMMVFVSVNQVLVRLWTRVPGAGSGASAGVMMTRRSALQGPGHGPLFDGMSDREVRPAWEFLRGWQPQRSAARVQRRCVND
jgi:hypothetical protein